MILFVQVAHVFFFGIAAGIWTGVIVTGKAPRTSLNPVVFIEWIQGAHATMKWFMPSFLAATLLSGLASFFLALGHGLQASLTGVGLVCLVLAIAVTRIVEVPIVNCAAQWSSAEPPSFWAEQRDRWMRFQSVRARAMLVGFAAASISLAVR